MGHTDEDDGTLARRVAVAGDPGAESELCRRFAKRIWLYGLRHLRDEQAASDLVQQVLVVLITALRDNRVHEPERLASFVLGTCRMLVRDLRRGDQKRQRLRDAIAHVVDAHEEPRLLLDSKRLRGCLEGLRPREQTVVVMTFFSERAADDIATELGMSAGNVRVVRHRAMEKLQACMGLATEAAKA